jgi:hypothetical protein
VWQGLRVHARLSCAQGRGAAMTTARAAALLALPWCVMIARQRSISMRWSCYWQRHMAGTLPAGRVCVAGCSPVCSGVCRVVRAGSVHARQRTASPVHQAAAHCHTLHCCFGLCWSFVAAACAHAAHPRVQALPQQLEVCWRACGTTGCCRVHCRHWAPFFYLFALA